MVSWCINTLDVRAGTHDLDQFIATCCEDDWLLRFDRLEAPPRRMRGNRLLDWRQAHWGTTLDVDPDDLAFERPDPRHAAWHFHSPTSPPLSWAENVARALPRLHLVLAYCVPDHGLLGRLELIDGRARPDGTWTRALPSDRLLCAEPGCWLYGESVVDDDLHLIGPPEVRCFRHRRAGATSERHRSAH